MPYKNELTQRAYQKYYQSQYKSSRKRVSVVLSVEEHKQWSTVANREKCSVGTLMKQMAEAYHSNQRVLSAEEKEKLDILVFELRAVGNTIHEVAHTLNIAPLAGREHSEDQSVHLLKQIHESLMKFEHSVHAIFKQ